jgi:hypothetical protein
MEIGVYLWVTSLFKDWDLKFAFNFKYVFMDILSIPLPVMKNVRNVKYIWYESIFSRILSCAKIAADRHLVAWNRVIIFKCRKHFTMLVFNKHVQKSDTNRANNYKN